MLIQRIGFIAARRIGKIRGGTVIKETSAGREVSLIAARRTGRIKGGEKVLLPEEHVEFEEELNRKYGRNQAENVD